LAAGLRFGLLRAAGLARFAGRFFGGCFFGARFFPGALRAGAF
jgi:hypothetical protein